MGDPRKFKNHYVSPKKLYDKDRIVEEKKLKELYGLRRNKEIWRALAILKNLRSRAKALVAEEDEEEKKTLFDKIKKMGFLKGDFDLEDVLKLEVKDILDRRLQTLVYKKGLARTPKQARQYIIHGHVMINNTKITVPSYLVPVEEEDSISLNPESSVAKYKDIEKESE